MAIDQPQKLAVSPVISRYCFSVDDWCYEVPAGGLSPGLTPEAGARRELSEEIGGTAADLRCVGQFYTSNELNPQV